MLVTGQSNGSPASGIAFSTTPSIRHSRFTSGVRITAAAGVFAPLIGLYEQDSDTGYGSGETLASSFCVEHDLLSDEANLWLCANHAKSNEGIAGIKKGGSATCYVDGMAQVQNAFDADPTYIANVIVLGHGENDSQSDNHTYGAQVEQLQEDYDTDIKEITEQPDDVLMYAWQCSAYPPGSTNAVDADKAGSTQLTVLSLALTLPTRFKCLGPTFNANYRDDNLHFTAAWNQVMGAYVAKCVNKVDEEEDDLPLYPTAAVRTDATVVVTFHVPVPPLIWRLDLYQNTTAGNTGALLGFKFYDDSGTPPAVTNVVISDTDEVTITLAGTPTGTQGSQEIRIGHSTSQTSGTGGTPLADSDDSENVDGWPLPNFCCQQYVPVTV